uniref:Uncharacterized protein n=1 Tax=Musca domestica TaxID=7370 RepID=A0A1I8MF44_MUSDO
MADPLTEPGEYENLPFHGLQTAPNKFTTPTTPTNFNNNTNVVRSVPRPKRLNGNISQTAPSYYDEQETDSQQQQQQQYYQHQQQQQQHHQYSTMPYNRQVNPANNARPDGGIIVHNNTLTANTLQHNQNGSALSGSGGGGSSPNSHQMAYNLNNCFPKSYTEYYQNQQQQQQQQQHHPFQQKYGSSPSASLGANNPSQLNAIEHDFNTYAVVERPHNTPASSVSSSSMGVGRTTNPFLAVSNFKKFDTSGDEDLQNGGASNGAGGGGGNYQTTSMKRQGKRKTFVDKLEDKRFYSLKFAGNKHNKASNKNAPLHLNAALIAENNGVSSGRVHEDVFTGSGSGRATDAGMLASLLSASVGGNKCKRHHSFAGGSLGDIESKGPGLRNGLHFYDPPAYENVNDAVQVHASAALSDMELPDPMSSAGTATVLLHPLPPYTGHNGTASAVGGGTGGSQGPKKKHHQRQHQPKEDLNLIEPERLSIYRSDSGISNSSYECVTPIPNGGGTQRGQSPATKTPRTPKTPKTPKGHKNSTLAHSAVTASFNSSHKKPAPRVPPTPLYMNVNDQSNQAIHNLERPSSPNSNMATSAYESASSSQNDTTCNDPTSMSSTTSLYNGGGGATPNSKMLPPGMRCNRHQPAPELTTPEEYEQYQLGHHSHAHSASSLSVASSISASGVGSSAVGRATKCKKQQRTLAGGGGGANINLMETNQLNKRLLAHNPFLATNPAASTATTCTKKFRRQTICDPYAHIKDIHATHQWRQLQQYLNANGSGQAHNYCPQSPNAFPATAAAVGASDKSSACVATKSHQQHGQSEQQQSEQIGLQQFGKATLLPNVQQRSDERSREQQFISGGSSSSNNNTGHTRHQQQMLMFYNKNIDTRNANDTDNNNKNNDDDDDNDDKQRPHNHNTETVASRDNDADDADDQVGGNTGLVKAKAVTVIGLPYRSQSFSLPTPLSPPHKSLNCDVADIDETKKTKNGKHNKGSLQYHHHQQQQPQRVEPDVRDPCIAELSNRPKLAMTIAAPNQSHYNPTLGCVGRPVKLPLRKYHSFHFQPTQMVAGQQLCKLQQLRAKQQQQQQGVYDLSQVITSGELYGGTSAQPEKPPLKEQHELYGQKGPLVFRHFELNKEVTFKPIQASEESEDSLDLHREARVGVGKSQGELYLDSGDFTNFTKLSVAPEGALNQDGNGNQELPPELPKTLPPLEIKSKNVSFLRDQGKTSDSNGNPVTKPLEKSPNSAFVKPPLNRSLENLGVAYITAVCEKSPKPLTTEGDLKKSFLNLDLNKNPPQLESPQQLKAIQQKAKENSQAKLLQLGKIYRLSSSENSEDDCLSGPKVQRKLFDSKDQQLTRERVLNPAASLEALEMLTKSQPQLWKSNQAGSRQNLHQLELFHTLQKARSLNKTDSKPGGKVANDDDEDLGYSYCEDDIEEEEELQKENIPGSQGQKTQSSPNVTVIMASKQGQESQVKFKLTQTHSEVKI